MASRGDIAPERVPGRWEDGSDLGFTVSLRRYGYAWLKTGSRHARDTFYEEKGWEQSAELQPLQTPLGEVAKRINDITAAEPRTAADKVEGIARIATTRVKPFCRHRLLRSFEV